MTLCAIAKYKTVVLRFKNKHYVSSFIMYFMEMWVQFKGFCSLLDATFDVRHHYVNTSFMLTLNVFVSGEVSNLKICFSFRDLIPIEIALETML